LTLSEIIVLRQAHPVPMARLRPIPGPEIGDRGLADSQDANARVLATCRRIRPADDFPFSRLVDQAIPDLEIHRQDAAYGGRSSLALLLG